jgi:phosphatidate cytidylyltransferase
VSGAACFIISFFIASGDLHQKYFLTIFPLLAIVFIIKLYKISETKPFTNVAFTLLGLVYIAVPLSLISFIAFADGRYRYEMILGTLLILWATDTGAYFAGTYLGKHKLFPRVSPKKTWEGFAGGAVLALIFAFGLSRYFDILSLIDWLIVGVIIIIGGTFGDLVESLLKRSIEIKDSGNVLPGHGGFLDRFDGLLIASPFLVAYVELFAR